MATISEPITTRYVVPIFETGGSVLPRDLQAVEEVLIREVIRNRQEINGNMSFGFPNADDNGQIDNILGSWVTITLNEAADLGTGGNSPITCTHNLDLTFDTNIFDPEGVNRIVDLPNVCWWIARSVYGDTSGTNAGPTRVANTAANLVQPWCIHYVQDAVTRDAIDLTFYLDTAIVPSSTEPVVLNMFFIPAEN